MPLKTALAVVALAVPVTGCSKPDIDFSDIDWTANIDYPQLWVGDYDGSADVYVYSTGHQYTNDSARLDIEKIGQDGIKLTLNVGTSGNTPREYIAICENVQSSTRLDCTYQTGGRRQTLGLGNNGTRVSGEWVEEQQRTDGGYDPREDISLNVLKD